MEMRQGPVPTWFMRKGQLRHIKGGAPLKSSNGCHFTFSAVSPRILVVLRSGKVL